ncbi:hypothetical protein H0I54_16425 [Yersinia kristensenii]|uniref:hypothetical protein n=1 Tax=Yersinia kristensenii TaxID=28152 RepID=UPI001C60F7CB|nr:hypothetical protein [Yersinia kristensenii]MBW5843395.1 hypothetical protein [Yersinia kristensenii]
MMDITKSREDFEKWLKSRDCNPVAWLKDAYWEVWKASRESIVLDLPEPGDYDYITQYAESVYMEIRTAGIRIKGESE